MLNKLILQSRLTADIELKQTQSGIAFTEFTVAWSEKYKETETKCFMRCKCWRGTAELLSKYFSKGSELIIEGKMVTEQWEKDGEKKSRTICDVQAVHFCGKKSDNQNNTSNGNSYSAPQPSGFAEVPADDSGEELPF